MSRGRWCAVLLLLALPACDPPKTDKASTGGAVELWAAGGNEATRDLETSAAVVPPGTVAASVDADCAAHGRVFVFSATGQRLLTRSLDGSGATTSAPIPSAGPGGGTGYDNQMVRLVDGSLLVVDQGSLTDAKGPRTAYHVWRTVDCGGTWTHSVLDSLAMVMPDQNGALAAGRCNGLDRQEVYADPFGATDAAHQRVYLTATCGNQATGYEVGGMFRSDDGGATWQATGTTLRDAPPHYLTTTPDGRLYVFECSGPTPTLSWSDDHGKSFSAGIDVSYVAKGKPVPCSISPLHGKYVGGSDTVPDSTWVPNGFAYTLGLSRAGDGVVRAVYPTVNGDRQSFRMVTVSVPTKANPDAESLVLDAMRIDSTDPNGSVSHLAMVETDHVGMPAGSTDDTAMLYWIDSTPSGVAGVGPTAVARYRLVRHGLSASPVETLSAASWVVRWTPNPNIAAGDDDNNWMGDYVKGAPFFLDGKVSFVAQWPESDASLPAPNMRVHYRVVVVEPRELPAPVPKPPHPAPPAPAPPRLQIRVFPTPLQT